MSETKAWLLADWFVHDLAPTWLLILGPDDPAVILRKVPTLRSRGDLSIARDHLDQVSSLMSAVTARVGGTAAERDLAADITIECIGGLVDFANFIASEGGEDLGSVAHHALKLAGIAGTNFLVAGVQSAPPAFRMDDDALRRALRLALQPTMDATNASIGTLGKRLAAAA